MGMGVVMGMVLVLGMGMGTGIMNKGTLDGIIVIVINNTTYSGNKRMSYTPSM